MALTKYKEGSIGELWSLALPLMISSLSVLSMLFVDRLFLAWYSTQALNAVVNATTLGWAFLMGWISLTSIAEVFVAQYNGAKEEHKLGEPVWQMIWLSILSWVCFIPLAISEGGWFFGHGADRFYEREYFKWMMLFGPSFPLYSALCSFFVGQGQPRLITIIAVIANVINIVLDAILIFGIEGWVPSYGVSGAAVATCGSTIFQLAILGYIFLKKKNRETKGTGNYQLQLSMLWHCLKIGFPSAIFSFLEIFAWALFYGMMTYTSEIHITVVGIGQSFFMLFFFLSEGLSKAASTLAGNFIGAKKSELINQVMVAGIKMHLAFFLLLTVGIVFTFDFIVEAFLPEISYEKLAILKPSLFFCLLLESVYLLGEGIRMLFSGALTAAGDTLFLLFSGTLSVWMFLVLPIYLVVVVQGGSVEMAMAICVLYSFVLCLCNGYRFVQGRWKEIALVS